MSKEIKKPENYIDDGSKKMKNVVLGSAIQIIFIILLMIWVVSSLFVSIKDVFINEFEHKWLSYSFIGVTFTSGYLIVSNYVKNRKLGIKPKKNCKKCGNNTTKK